MSIIVRIENSIQEAFNIMIEEGTLFTHGKWRTLTQGRIVRNLGDTDTANSAGTLTTFHLLLRNKDIDGWLVRLNDFGDVWGYNQNGDGLLAEGAVISVKDGYIKWEIVKIPDVS